MKVTIEIPDWMVPDLKEEYPDLQRAILEAFVADGFQAGKISRGDVEGLLDVDREGSIDFLNARGCTIEYSSETIEQGRKNIQQLIKQGRMK